MKINGRENDIALLEQLYESKRPEFVVVYGRRRVGKTYLVSELFKSRFSFYHTGLSPLQQDKKNILYEQLHAFYTTLRSYGLDTDIPQPQNWLDAFELLKSLLIRKKNGNRQVVFIDEMPWLDTPRSNFITAFEHFWNGWGARQEDLMLIVCGSATSWMKQTLVNNKGGLYNRVTREIKILPFNLHDTELLLQENGVKWSRFDIAQFYMIAGGIPQYINFVQPKQSLPQAVDSIFFADQAPLKQEFERLFGSLFNHADEYMKVVRLIGKTHIGLTRKDLLEKLKKKDGGTFTTILKNLVMSDFLLPYTSFSENKWQERYKLIDPFCRFYLTFMEGKHPQSDFWQQNGTSGQLNAWRGNAFEELCFNHVPQIKHALGIPQVSTTISKWALQGSSSVKGSQIDMIIDRADNIVDLCEMKFSNGQYAIDKSYDLTLRDRLQALSDRLPKRKMPHLIFITSFGLKQNEYAGIVQDDITIDNLFQQ